MWIKKLLVDVIKNLYDKSNNHGVATKPYGYEEGDLDKIDGLLSQSDVIQTLSRYCLHDPNYDKYQIEYNKRYDLVKTQSTASNILFLRIREYTWLYIQPKLLIIRAIQ